jgi:hypothetical protein
MISGTARAALIISLLGLPYENPWHSIAASFRLPRSCNAVVSHPTEMIAPRPTRSVIDPALLSNRISGILEDLSYHLALACPHGF